MARKSSWGEAPDEAPPEDVIAPSPLAALSARVGRQLLLCVAPWRASESGPAPTRTLEQAHRDEEAAIGVLAEGDEAALQAALAPYRAFHLEEEDRKRSVESRLTTVLSLASLVTAIIVGVFSAVFEKGLAASHGLLGWAAVALFLYAILQLLFSVWQAVRGLKVQLVAELTPSDELVLPGEARKDQLLRAVVAYSEALRDHDRINGAKHECLERSHRGIVNFLLGMSVLVLFMAVSALRPAAAPADADRVAERLRDDPAFLEKARGPTGPPGAAPSPAEVAAALRADPHFVEQVRAGAVAPGTKPRQDTAKRTKAAKR
jgi:hypothetical protein